MTWIKSLKTKIRLKTGRVVKADLWGEKGGDLFGGNVKIGKKTYVLGSPKNNLPKRYFPIKRTTKRSPFVDF